MPFNPVSPVTGAAISGFTAPTYTLSADTPPAINSKQYAVSAVGGTQTGVDINAVSKPFTVTFFRPAVLRSLPAANPVTGVIKNVPNNVYKLITRKGVAPAANQPSIPVIITTEISVPAGSDTYEPEDIKAALSAHFGVGWQSADDISKTLLTGVM